MQGGVFSPFKCTVQIDTLGKDCLSFDECLSKYKNTVSVPPLALIESVAAITKSGADTVQMNAKINMKMESKKLRLSAEKCNHMYIAKNKSECSINLKVHDEMMKKTESCSYLGDVLSSDGSLDLTIEERRQKGVGIVSQISSILSSISMGFFFMEIAFTLRESLLINGTLTNSEVWPNIRKEHLESLEAADLNLMRKIFNSHSKTAYEIFFLEPGKLPLRFVVYKRRLMYLRHVLYRDENS